ncbi:hypothetical protein BCR36DRAFT_585047 [Piromyces finnis]|uniref:Biogenesis of lysosome-related organelles complex 1 subunit 7 n=1 Tax=Piromyces finnis TaxID=1754191 RepID=A0A1Y1V5P4_9FUNG|nr:hypothetical protein BCR36DRAFT_585047 [Piromyces finnis]|eukprot:ORX46934.1 hypothetical protein BCR36DRAFT_585047 [Piromyces finnis]
MSTSSTNNNNLITDCLTSEPVTEPVHSSPKAMEETKNNIMQKVTPLIQELDMQVVGVRLSQLELYKEIERLSAELQLCQDLPEMPQVSDGIQRLQNLQKRIQTINKTLRVVQDRLNRVANINNIQ